MESIAIVANPRKPLSASVLPELIGWLGEKGLQVKVERDAEAALRKEEALLCSGEELRSCELIVALGGDGTLLKAARIVGSTGIPILGVNLGGLGFLTEVVLEELYPMLTTILDGKDFKLEPRMVLEASVDPGGKVFHALNDIVVSMGGSGRMVGLTTWVENEWVANYAADGIIVATPTGSTAYSLAANGPIVTPTMEAIIINPICPHTLGLRPVVISGGKVVTIDIDLKRGGSAQLVSDGQETHSLDTKTKIRVKKADHYINLIKSPKRSFYEILRTKLSWGGREDVKESQC